MKKYAFLILCFMFMQVLAYAKEITVEQSNNLFAFDLYEQYKTEGNVFVSPYSISTALTMSYEGSSGSTANEMRAALHLSGNKTKVRKEMRSLQMRLNLPDSKYKLKVANALWVESTFPIEKDYLSLVNEYYNANATNLNFLNQTEQSRLTINRWVEEKTDNKIKDLIAKDTLNPSAKLLLTNTIYFKAEWLNPFEKDLTAKKPFYLSTDKHVEVPMMHNLDNYKYGENRDVQIIELDYLSDLSMLVILPKKDIQGIESKLSLAKLSRWKSLLKNKTVALSLPKFKFESKYNLNQCLNDLGIASAFNSKTADFTLINPTKGLFISKVIHQAYIEVTELGTEAAAATAVGQLMEMIDVDDEPKEFNANHPFLFIIQEKYSGNILFIGKMNNPQE